MQKNSTIKLKYIHNERNLNHFDYNEGDLVFCKSNNNIYIKHDGQLVAYGANNNFFIDVPDDDLPYTRKNNQWVPLSDDFDFTLFPIPETPTIISPNNDATISAALLVRGSRYNHPYGISMSQKEIEIYLDDNSTSGINLSAAQLVYNKCYDSVTETFEVNIDDTGEFYLKDNTAYYIRIRYADVRNIWSKWSECIRVIIKPTSINSKYFITPQITMPIQDGNLSSNTYPLFTASTPKTIVGSTNFTTSHWQIAHDSEFTNLLFECANNNNATTIIINKNQNDLDNINDIDFKSFGEDAQFYVRMRQNTLNDGPTNWSIPHKFTISNSYNNNVFGFRRIFSKSDLEDCQVYNIDEEGNKIHLSEEYFMNHPLYKFEEKVLRLTYWKSDYTLPSGNVYDTDKDFFVTVPRCWIKYEVYYDDDNLVIDLWFTTEKPTNNSGWMLHPAFIDPKVNEIYISKCLCKIFNLKDIGGPNVQVFRSNDVEITPSYDSYSKNIGYYANTKLHFNRRVGQLYYGIPASFNIFHRMLISDLTLAKYHTYNLLLGIRNLYNRYYWLNNTYDSYTNLAFEEYDYRYYIKKDSELEYYIDPITQLELSKSYNYNTIDSVVITNPNTKDSFSVDIVEAPKAYIDGGRNVDTFYKVNSIATGYESALGFDKALLMIANGFEKVVDDAMKLTVKNMAFGFYNNLPMPKRTDYSTTPTPIPAMDARYYSGLVPMMRDNTNFVSNNYINNPYTCGRLVLYRYEDQRES